MGNISIPKNITALYAQNHPGITTNSLTNTHQEISILTQFQILPHTGPAARSVKRIQANDSFSHAWYEVKILPEPGIS